MNSSPSSQPDSSCVWPEDQAAEIAYEMAYGLSHELNNPLANIAGRARLLAEQESDPEKRHQLAVIVDQAMRGCEMIADLMLVARPPAWQPTDVDLSLLVSELCSRAQRVALDRPIEVRLESSEASAHLHADRTALSEALWAVLRNALEAAETTITVQLSGSAEDNDAHWLIRIVDDGPGLSEKAMAYAFHPYFSGREAGRGIGLGLSKARRILSLCGGRIALTNGQATGCEALITLPHHQSEQD